MLVRHIKYFLAVAEHHSFTRAAAALHVSQPALSQQIKQLEESLGAQLFDRTGRTTRLTDAGEVYFRYARRALQGLEEGKRAIHDVGDLSRGSLRIAVTPTFTSYLVGPLVESFHGRYPGVTLTVREMSQERMEELLVDDELDAGIAFEEVRSQDIDAQRLLVETLALVVGRHHPLAKRRSVRVDALNDESLILLSAEFATREHIDRYCRQNDLRPQVLMEVNSISAVIEVIQRTRLSTLLPATIARGREDLVAVALDPLPLQRTAVLMQRKGAYQTAAARAFIEVALDVAGTLARRPKQAAPASRQ
ncbi:transcriptional regulator [Burkholderia ubonensis]|uniref:transcriptional regulator CynR n=1 Tax=Burkholderia ubonensis TaxID=101571 RepID=UPI00075CD445|nr:transcriptional regulator CynR [Burkholderia ubonensis]KWE65077.1 transcriptional regulator [Burkholderia ubonensis]KWE78521.1 transcriptional regulator [Burkholderia ubonensis]